MSSTRENSANVRRVSRETMPGFQAHIEAWLNAHLPDCAHARVRSFREPTSNGLSGETFIISVEQSGAAGTGQNTLVLRKDVRDQQTNPQSGFHNLVTTQTVLGDIGTLPVPRVLGVEASPDVIGAPFFVMEFVEGDIPSDIPSYADSGWVRAATAGQRARMWRSGIDFLVRLHAVDRHEYSLDGLRFNTEGGDDVERCLNYSIALYREEAEGHETPVVEEAISWLRANRPSAGAECICWGDARIGNMIWRDFECAAAIDWEMSSLGCPGIDLGWWSFFHRWSTRGQGFPELEGMCVGQELADLYEELGGRRIDDFPYFELLAAVRGLSIWLRAYKAMVPGGPVPDALHDSVHMVHVLQTLMNEIT